jgi:hypothetical protein
MPSSPNVTLDLLATIIVEVVPFRAFAPFPVIPLFFKFILEVVFCEGVQHRLRFYLDHLTCVKMAAFQFYLQWGNRKIVWWGTTVMLVLVKNFLV